MGFFRANMNKQWNEHFQLNSVLSCKKCQLEGGGKSVGYLSFHEVQLSC